MKHKWKDHCFTCATVAGAREGDGGAEQPWLLGGDQLHRDAGHALAVAALGEEAVREAGARAAECRMRLASPPVIATPIAPWARLMSPAAGAEAAHEDVERPRGESRRRRRWRASTDRPAGSRPSRRRRDSGRCRSGRGRRPRARPRRGRSGRSRESRSPSSSASSGAKAMCEASVSMIVTAPWLRSEQGDAEAGAGAEHGGDAVLGEGRVGAHDRGERIGAEHRHRISDRAEIVEQDQLARGPARRPASRARSASRNS